MPFPVCTGTCTCGAQQKDNVFRFLMGLNESYGNLKNQILLTELQHKQNIKKDRKNFLSIHHSLFLKIFN